MKKFFLSLFFVCLISLLLIYPKDSIAFAKDGLLTWFHTMLPTLMPFMILSTLMISLHLVDFVGAEKYCILMGFLCGFPMGAKVVTDLYKKGGLNLQKANDLLGFCNNLGPIFILNFALPSLGIKNPFWCLIGFYGIPFLYGLILLHKRKGNMKKNHANILNVDYQNMHLLYHIDDAIQCAISSITILGGYMIFFNLLNIIPYAIHNFQCFTDRNSFRIFDFIRCLIEISGGLNSLTKPSLFILCLIPIGGLSCLAQVYSIIKDTDLSFSLYLKHKCIQTLLIYLYFLLLAFFHVSFY